MKILVTGGAGFIGSNLVDRLVSNGDEVIVVDNLSTGKKENINSKAKFIQLNTSSKEMAEIIEKEKPEIIYHLAGPIHLRRSIDDPLFQENLNILKELKHLLDAAHEVSVKKFIMISSGGAVYSEASVIPTPEDYPAHPSSLYGVMNLALERLLQDYAETYNLPYIILRLSNVYGPRQWESGIIPSVATKMLQGQQPIIHGDGTTTRDFIFISDVLEALRLAADSGKTGIFNVGSSQETSMTEVFKIIAQRLSWKGDPIYEESSDAGVSRNALDRSKIQEELGWKPQVSFEQGIQQTIQALQEKN
ncbi:MAG: GDP-mannose 4,6-dehydratase [Patescibacteria group bacterium]|nr:GDP-mannose 4,6-dehydratase [Patescibacteria group bacterium]